MILAIYQPPTENMIIISAIVDGLRTWPARPLGQTESKNVKLIPIQHRSLAKTMMLDRIQHHLFAKRCNELHELPSNIILWHKMRCLIASNIIHWQTNLLNCMKYRLTSLFGIKCYVRSDPTSYFGQKCDVRSDPTSFFGKKLY